MGQYELPATGERLVTSVFNYVAIDHLHRYAIATQFVDGKDVLDIASGEGYGANLLSMRAKSVIGVDISSEAVIHASQKYNNVNLKFAIGSAAKIPIPDSSVDVVVSFETIEHHDEHDNMMKEVKRVLRSNGLLIISSPDKLNYSDIPNYKNPFHIKELYKEEFVFLLRKYFRNMLLLNQKSVFGSLIVPEAKSYSFLEFEGDYSNILTFREIRTPIYHVCIASDIQIESVPASFFNGRNSTDFEQEERIRSAQINEINYLKTELGFLRKLKLHWVLVALRKLKVLGKNSYAKF